MTGSETQNKVALIIGIIAGLRTTYDWFLANRAETFDRREPRHAGKSAALASS